MEEASAEFAALIDRAVQHVIHLTASLEDEIELSRSDWVLDQDAGTISFTSTKADVVAPVQIIGTYDTSGGTWLWAWDHPSVARSLSEDSRALLELGDADGIEILSTAAFSCDEQACWELTALAALMNDSRGAYRGRSGDVGIYMTFGELSPRT